MPRFFFHLVGATDVEDPEGYDYHSAEDAKLEAERAARDLARNARDPRLLRTSIRVTDETGCEVCLIAVGGVPPSSG